MYVPSSFLTYKYLISIFIFSKTTKDLNFHLSSNHALTIKHLHVHVQLFRGKYIRWKEIDVGSTLTVLVVCHFADFDKNIWASETCSGNYGNEIATYDERTWQIRLYVCWSMVAKKGMQESLNKGKVQKKSKNVSFWKGFLISSRYFQM